MSLLNKKVAKNCFLFLLFILLGNVCYSASIDELKQKIDETSQSKAKLEKEIEQYQKQLKEIGEEANTLTTAVKTLEATEKKTILDIKLTENNITSTELEIERLAIAINKKEAEMRDNNEVIYQTLNEINRADTSTLVENLLTYNDLAEFWNDVESLYKVQNKIKQKLVEIKTIKTDLEKDKKDNEIKKGDLITYKQELGDKKTILEINKKEKNKLLTDTKNKESNDKKILEQKKALSAAFEKELAQFESELKFTIDPKSIPAAGKGILSWPLDKIYVTQKYGYTDFALSSKAYANGHNGVDFRASVGTRVKASLSGIVEGIGDTDIVCSGASYGKWVLITHSNGLTTLYGHLSLIKVKAGDKVYTGDIIGYSGNTGFSTGPHLHFGLFASQGVKIMDKKSAVCKGTYTMPVADVRAYLDPLQYL